MQKKPRTKPLLYNPNQDNPIVNDKQGPKSVKLIPKDAASSIPAKKETSSEDSDDELADNTRLPSWRGKKTVPREAYPQRWREIPAPERTGENVLCQKRTSTPLIHSADEEQRKDLPFMHESEGGGGMPVDIPRSSGSGSSFETEPNKKSRMQSSQTDRGSLEVDQQLLLANLIIPSESSILSTWFNELIGPLPVISNSAEKSVALPDKSGAQGSQSGPSYSTRQTRSVTREKEKMSLLKRVIHSPLDSDLGLLAEKDFTESIMVKSARKTRSVIHENKGKELITEIQCLADQTINATTGLNLLKKYGRKYILGTVVGYDVAKKLFKISYENGDDDEISLETMTLVVNTNTTAEQPELRSLSAVQEKVLATTQKRKSSRGTVRTKSPPTKRAS